MRIGIWISTMCWSDTNPTSFFVSVPEKNHLNQGILRHRAVMGCFVTSSWMLLNGDSRTSLKWNDMVWIQGQQTPSVLLRVNRGIIKYIQYISYPAGSLLWSPFIPPASRHISATACVDTAAPNEWPCTIIGVLSPAKSRT